jgi:hypothetical protein
MAITVQGKGGVAAEVDGTGFRALRVTIRPLEYGALGAYASAVADVANSVQAGFGGPNQVWYFRWNNPSVFACVSLFKLNGFMGSDTGFTAGFAEFSLWLYTGVGRDSSGGLRSPPTSTTLNRFRLRRDQQTSCLADIEYLYFTNTISWTSGVRTQTKIGQLSTTLTTATWTNWLSQGVLFDARYVGPAVLSGRGNGAPWSAVYETSQALVLKATVPATGIWRYCPSMHWTEVAEY